MARGKTNKKAVSKRPVTATVKKTVNSSTNKKAPVKKVVTKSVATKSVTSKSSSTLSYRLGKLYSSTKLSSLWSTFKGDKRLWIVAGVLGLLLLGVAKKEWFVAAMVNGSPISNFEVQKRLNQQFKSQVVNQLADEKVIKDEAKKRGVVINPADVDQKIAELEKNFGGAEVLDSLLTQQGQTREGLRKNLELQIIIEKLYASEATVSAEEIDQFLSQNSAQLQATDEAAQRKEAEDQLKQQKLGQLFSQKFQELKQNANIQIF